MIFKNRNVDLEKIKINGLKELKEIGGGLYAINENDKIIDEVVILKNYNDVVRYCNNYYEGYSILILSENTYKIKDLYILTEE